MAKTKRLFKSFYRLLLPVVILLFLAVAAGSIGLLYKTSQPQTGSYLVTPEKYGRLSASGARVTDETWTNGTERRRAAGFCAARTTRPPSFFYTATAQTARMS